MQKYKESLTLSGDRKKANKSKKVSAAAFFGNGEEKNQRKKTTIQPIVEQLDGLRHISSATTEKAHLNRQEPPKRGPLF